MDTALKYLEENRKRHQELMFECLRMETVSAKSEKEGEIRRCGDWLVKLVADMGFENAALQETGGLPAVYADWLHAGADKPTILVYGHFDVQPPEPLDLWETPPFEPTIRDGRVFGRGTADDKCQLLIHVFALEALLKIDGKLPINIKLFFESEEEGGTGSTPKFVEEHRDLLACDAVMLSDTAWMDEENPVMMYGLRGISYFQADFKGPNRDLHSGRFGGVVQNPIEAMATVIARLHDEKGRIAVPTIYNDVVPISPEERAELAKLGDNTEETKRYLAVDALAGEEGYSPFERNWARPALDVHGIWGGYQDEGSKTVIASKCGFKASMRLVPNQEPKKVFEACKTFIEEVCPKGVQVNVEFYHGGEPLMVPIDNPYLRCAQKSLEKAFDKPALLIREGASVPITATFKDALGALPILMGFDVPTGNIHAPNENFILEHFFKGMEAALHFYRDAATV